MFIEKARQGVTKMSQYVKDNSYSLLLNSFYIVGFWGSVAWQQGGGDGTSLLSDLKCFVDQLAFYGAIIGIFVYGLANIFSAIFPEYMQQMRQYLKNLAKGVVLIGVSYTAISYVFGLLGMTTYGALTCSSSGS